MDGAETAEPWPHAVPRLALVGLVVVVIGVVVVWLALNRWAHGDEAASARVAQEQIQATALPPGFLPVNSCGAHGERCALTAQGREEAARTAGRWLSALGYTMHEPFCGRPASEPCIVDGSRDGLKASALALPPLVNGRQETLVTFVVTVGTRRG